MEEMKDDGAPMDVSFQPASVVPLSDPRSPNIIGNVGEVEEMSVMFHDRVNARAPESLQIGGHRKKPMKTRSAFKQIDRMLAVPIQETRSIVDEMADKENNE